MRNNWASEEISYVQIMMTRFKTVRKCTKLPEENVIAQLCLIWVLFVSDVSPEISQK